MNQGEYFKEISGDLTNGGKKGDVAYGTLTSVHESDLEFGLIYTGSDDGFVQVTRDNGENWTNVTPKGLAETLINAIEVSPHDPATVYVATTRYKFNDQTPALYKSTNYGKSWKNITGNLPTDEYTRVVREDTERKDLLLAGTFRGVYVSFDGGGKWSRLKLNLPVTPITDLAIKDNDLVVATMGRSFWIFDDMALLRQYDGNTTVEKLYTPETAIWSNWRGGMNSSSSTGTDSFEGVNPATGMIIYYNLPKIDKKKTLTLEIRDSNGNLVNQFSSKKDSTYVKYEGSPSIKATVPTKKGLNRFVWDMRHSMLKGLPKVYIEGSFRGHKVIPGTYELKLTYGDKVMESSAVIESNPLYEVTPQDYLAYHEFMTAGEKTYNEMTQMTINMFELQGKLKEVIGQLKGTERAELLKEAKSLQSEMKAWDSIMVQRLSKAYDDVENFENGFTAHYITAINQMDGSIVKITEGARKKVSELNAQWDVYKKSGKDILEIKVPALNKSLFDSGIGVLYSKK